MIDRGMLYTYLNSYHTPDRMVVAGAGVEHSDLVQLAEEYFVKKTPIWKEHENLIDPSREKDVSLAQYTGGSLPVGLSLQF